MENCTHEWIYARSNSYYRIMGPSDFEYYHADYFYCKYCLEEKVIEKKHNCKWEEKYNRPNWAQSIENKIKSNYDN